MPSLKLEWTHFSKRQFDDLRQRAKDTGHSLAFIKTHNEIVAILRDLESATEKGDPLYHTKKTGGTVRHLLHEFISVTYAVFVDAQVGWVTNYVPVPPSWPEK